MAVPPLNEEKFVVSSFSSSSSSPSSSSSSSSMSSSSSITSSLPPSPPSSSSRPCCQRFADALSWAWKKFCEGMRWLFCCCPKTTKAVPEATEQEKAAFTLFFDDNDRLALPHLDTQGFTIGQKKETAWKIVFGDMPFYTSKKSLRLRLGLAKVFLPVCGDVARLQQALFLIAYKLQPGSGKKLQEKWLVKTMEVSEIKAEIQSLMDSLSAYDERAKRSERTKSFSTCLLKELNARGWHLGGAVDNGGCLFDAVASSLSALQGEQHTEKSLRMVVSDYIAQLNQDKNWVKERMSKKHDQQGEIDSYEYLKSSIKYTQEEVELLRIMGGQKKRWNAIWGSVDIDLRIFMEVFDINIHLHEVDLYELDEEDSDHLVTHHYDGKRYKMTYSSKDLGDKNKPTIHIAGYPGHFMPVRELFG